MLHLDTPVHLDLVQLDQDSELVPVLEHLDQDLEQDLTMEPQEPDLELDLVMVLLDLPLETHLHTGDKANEFVVLYRNALFVMLALASILIKRHELSMQVMLIIILEIKI